MVKNQDQVKTIQRVRLVWMRRIAAEPVRLGHVTPGHAYPVRALETVSTVGALVRCA